MREINASIITIGDELLIGQTIDTNSAFIAKELNKIGVWIKRRVAVGDVKEEILSTLREESKKAEIIIITGGLGPTADDITKPALCEYFGASMVTNEAVLDHVKNIFLLLKRPVLERNLKQAEVPGNCTVLHNARGTAPGMWFQKEGVIYISLPGVPHEMQGLITDEVVPRLKKHFTLPVILHKSLLTAGKGESEIAEEITSFEEALPDNIKLAYLPAYGMVKLRLTAKGANGAAVQQQVNEQFEQLKGMVQPWLVTDEDKTVQQVVIDTLKRKEKTLATAESCTGGYIAHLITSLPGSSAVYKGSVISYANEAKANVLQVPENVLQQHGAVSEETVVAMVKGALQTLNVDYAIATSGIMGPGGGTNTKPVGTVWVAVASRNKVKAVKHFVRFNRSKNIEVSAQYALNMLRLLVMEEG